VIDVQANRAFKPASPVSHLEPISMPVMNKGRIVPLLKPSTLLSRLAGEPLVGLQLGRRVSALAVRPVAQPGHRHPLRIGQAVLLRRRRVIPRLLLCGLLLTIPARQRPPRSLEEER
jgi:hypothetical protein